MYVAPKVPSCLLSANFYIVIVFMRMCAYEIRRLSALLVVLLHAAIYD